MIRLVVLFAFLAIASVAATDVRQCTKDRPFPLSVIIDGCLEMPCDIVKGTTAIMDVHFLGTRDNIRGISTQVRATALGVTVPYSLPTEVADVCANLMYEAQCPIDKDEDVVYSFRFAVDNTYPEISCKIEASLVDDLTNESVACFVADIKVKKGSTEQP